MRALLLVSLLPFAAGSAFAQDHAHGEHETHEAPASPAPADAHEGHAGHGAAAPDMSAAPPPVPTDHAADRLYPPDRMAAARAQMRREHGDLRWSQILLETAELRLGDGDEGYAWEGRASFGGDINRFTLKSEGDGEFEGDLYELEFQALYTRAIGPYFDLQAGLRHDIEPDPETAYAVLGIDGLAPYWFEIETAVFLSEDGDLSARLEGSYDLRVTQRLVLEPRAELNFAAQDVPALGVGSGLSDAELGLRLRYEITPAFAPYIGVHHEEAFGDTGDFARAAGRDTSDTRVVIGLRAWY